ncbi:MAG: two-component system response regulator [Verrucomicrobiales bacterium]|nr:two-component system response regulator [Verrucomicrobiales bacterium]
MQPKPILIADDDEGDVMFLEHQFKTVKLLNPINMVTDGEQVVCYLKGEGRFADRTKYPYPLILLLDLRMPRMGGLEILSFLRASPEHRNLPVIILSVLGELKDMNQAYKLGANSFLVKPIDINDLVCTLRGVKHLAVRVSDEGFWLEAD